MKKVFTKTLLILVITLILCLSIRGVAGNIDESNFAQPKIRENGPFELSPERGRYALTYSIFQDHSPFFSVPVARFATPDLGLKNGKFVSLFAPAVSFIIAPGFLIGRHFGLSQVGSYAVISIFAILNTLLIIQIAVKLGANKTASTIAGLTFLFATPAFAYAVNLYQHHISTFLILMSIYLLVKFRGLFPLFAIWFLCFASIPVDYPNLIFMLPIGIYALGRLINIEKIKDSTKISFKLLGLLTFVSAVLPIAFFLWFNKISYNNPFQLSGTVESVKIIDQNNHPITPHEFNEQKDSTSVDSSSQKTSVGFFQTRNILNSLYIHFISVDRGMLVYTPVLLFSLVGAVILYRKRPQVTAVLAAVIGANILLYSMWSDPWGGWAFGSRYLIPSYSLLAIFLAITLTKFKKSTFFLVDFYIILIYSLAVNTLGALTTSRIPPELEAKSLETITHHQEKYSFDRNIDFLIKENKSKSFVFQTYLSKYITAWQYYLIISLLASSLLTSLIIYLRLQKEK